MKNQDPPVAQLTFNTTNLMAGKASCFVVSRHYDFFEIGETKLEPEIVCQNLEDCHEYIKKQGHVILNSDERESDSKFIGAKPGFHAFWQCFKISQIPIQYSDLKLLKF